MPIAGLAGAIIFTYWLMRSLAAPPRRKPTCQAPTTSSFVALDPPKKETKQEKLQNMYFVFFS